MSLFDEFIICKKLNCGIRNNPKANYCKECGGLLEKNDLKGTEIRI